MPRTERSSPLPLPAGMRATRAVVALLRLLPAQPDGGWTQALVETALQQQGIAVNRVTVYRALDFLLENGLVHRIASLNAFMGCSHPEHVHQGQFLICRECHVALELEQSSISDAIVASAKDVGFSVETQTVEVVGLCASCRSA